MTRWGGATTTRYRVTVGSRALDVEVVEDDGGLRVRVDRGESVTATVRRPRGDALHSYLVGGRAFSALVEGREGAYSVVIDGEALDLLVQDERAARLARVTVGGRQGQAERSVTAPMPGLVVAVQVEAGQRVSAGASLVVLQAMKMENDLTAREEGTIKEVLVSAGQTVDQGQTLVTLE